MTNESQITSICRQSNITSESQASLRCTKIPSKAITKFNGIHTSNWQKVTSDNVRAKPQSVAEWLWIGRTESDNANENESWLH